MARVRKKMKRRETPVSPPTKGYVVTLDPGIDCGFAVWQGETWYTGTLPVYAGVIKTDARSSWLTRFEGGLERLGDIFEDWFPLTYVVCEWPQFYNTAKGAAVAGRDDLGKLYAWVGGAITVAHRESANFVPVNVAQWKGQLSKRVVCDRIEQTLGAGGVREIGLSPRKKGEGSHDWDAVGIGLWAKGLF